jgi:hypothetical protein
MGVTTARPEWTRSSPGIPVDTVVRLDGGSQGQPGFRKISTSVVAPFSMNAAAMGQLVQQQR